MLNLLRFKKYFSGVFVGLLFGAVAETLFMFPEIVEEALYSFILFHFGLIVSLIIATWIFIKISNVAEILDRQKVYEYINYPKEIADGIKNVTYSTIVNSFKLALELTPLNPNDEGNEEKTAKEFMDELDSINRRFRWLIFWGISSAFFFLASLLTNIIARFC